jgi:hypothetical protein
VQPVSVGKGMVVDHLRVVGGLLAREQAAAGLLASHADAAL